METAIVGREGDGLVINGGGIRDAEEVNGRGAERVNEGAKAGEVIMDRVRLGGEED